MNSSNKERAVFRYLLTKSIDGQITPAEIKQLNILWNTYPDLEKYYFDIILLQYLLPEAKIAADFNQNTDSILSDEFWMALADHEKTAVGITLPQEKPKRELIQKVVYPSREKRKLSKGQIVKLAMSAAAVILIALFVRFVPPKGVEVATLIDSIDAVWMNEADSLQTGNRLVGGQQERVLLEGIVKLLFDNSATVLIESPAEFRILSEDSIELFYGRLYTQVPPQAIGFTVSTLLAKIVDLGTEFGIDVDGSGDTTIHVIKGKASLTAGGKSKQQPVLVDAGSARKVSADTATITDVDVNSSQFIRDINSSRNLIWRGDVIHYDGQSIHWTSDSGNWSDAANWSTGKKPDGTQSIRLQKGASSVCVLNTAETPVSVKFTADDGQTLNIENGGYMGCGWARFGDSVVNMTGNGTWLLNDDDLYIGFSDKGVCSCIWTMYDHSRIDINEDQDDGEVLYIAQNNGKGTLRLVGSNVTVNCDRIHIGYIKKPGTSPHATLEYVMDANGASTIHVGYRIYLSEPGATSHLVLSAAEPLPLRDIVLIENAGSDNKIRGNGAFDTMNGGSAVEGTTISLGGNRYRLTYQYEANGDGNHNDIALIFLNAIP